MSLLHASESVHVNSAAVSSDCLAHTASYGMNARVPDL